MAGKPRKIDRPVEKKVSIPESVTTRVDILLFSEVEGKVPHGAWSELITRLLTQYLNQFQQQGQ